MLCLMGVMFTASFSTFADFEFADDDTCEDCHKTSYNMWPMALLGLGQAVIGLELGRAQVNGNVRVNQAWAQSQTDVAGFYAQGKENCFNTVEAHRSGVAQVGGAVKADELNSWLRTCNGNSMSQYAGSHRRGAYRHHLQRQGVFNNGYSSSFYNGSIGPHGQGGGFYANGQNGVYVNGVSACGGRFSRDTAVFGGALGALGAFASGAGRQGVVANGLLGGALGGACGVHGGANLNFQANNNFLNPNANLNWNTNNNLFNPGAHLNFQANNNFLNPNANLNWNTNNNLFNPGAHLNFQANSNLFNPGAHLNFQANNNFLNPNANLNWNTNSNFQANNNFLNPNANLNWNTNSNFQANNNFFNPNANLNWNANANINLNPGGWQRGRGQGGWNRGGWNQGGGGWNQGGGAWNQRGGGWNQGGGGWNQGGGGWNQGGGGWNQGGGQDNSAWLEEQRRKRELASTAYQANAEQAGVARGDFSAAFRDSQAGNAYLQNLASQRTQDAYSLGGNPFPRNTGGQYNRSWQFQF